MLQIAERPAAAVNVSRMDERIIKLLDRVAYKRATSAADLEQVRKIRYGAYLRAKMIDGKSAGLEGGEYSDDYDRDPNCFIFGVYLEGTMVGTFRLHVADRSNRSLPSAGVVPDLADRWLDEGLTLVDATRFAHVEGLGPAARMLPYATIRLTALAGVHFNADYNLQVVQSHHAPFYMNATASELIEVRQMQLAGDPFEVSVMRADFHYMRKRCAGERAYFLSSRREREQLFGSRHEGFVIPSVREIVSGEEDSGY